MRHLVGRLGALLVAFMLLASAALGLGETAAAGIRYSDVSMEHAAYEAIEYLTSRGVVNGYPDGTFGVDDPLTRAAATKIAVQVAGFAGQTESDQAPFVDVPGSHWSAPFVRTGVVFGLVRGFEDETFRPDLPLTRAELAALAVRATRQSQERLPNLTLADVRANEWYYAVAHLAVAAGMMDAPDGRFRPNEPATRAEAAQAFARAMIFAPGALDTTVLPMLNPLAGRVDVRSPGEMNYRQVARPIELPVGAQVRTSLNGEASIEFPDGSGVLLDNSTEIRLVRSFGLDLVSGAGVEDLEVELLHGSMITAIAPRLDAEELVARTWYESGAGVQTIARSVQGPAATGTTSGSNLPAKAAGLMLFADPGSLEPGDSQGAELTIVLVDAAGEPVTATDGPVTLELLTDVGRVSNANPVIPTGYQAVTVTVYPPAREPADAKTRFTAVAGDLSSSLTVSTSNSSWWRALFTKKTRATVRMPWAVASVRGTIVRTSVTEDGISLSVLDGTADFTSQAGETRQVSGGQYTAMSSAEEPPAPPSEMPPQEREKWDNRSEWVREQVQRMTQNAPPELREVIQQQEQKVNEQLPPPSPPAQPPQPPAPPQPPTPPAPQPPVTDPEPGPPLPSATLTGVTWVTGENGPMLEVTGRFTIGAGFQSATLNGQALSSSMANGFTVRLTPQVGVNRTVTLVVRDQLGRQATQSRNYSYSPADPAFSTVNLPGDGSGVMGLIGNPVQFELTLRDAANQRLGRGGDLVTVEPTPGAVLPNMIDAMGEWAWGQVDTNVTYDQVADKYLITLTANESASAYLSIRVNGQTFHTFHALFPFGDLSVADSTLYLTNADESSEGWQTYQVNFKPHDAFGNPIFDTGVPSNFSLTASVGELADIEDKGDRWTALLRLPLGETGQVTLTAKRGDDELVVIVTYGEATSVISADFSTLKLDRLYAQAGGEDSVTVTLQLRDHHNQPVDPEANGLAVRVQFLTPSGVIRSDVEKLGGGAYSLSLASEEVGRVDVQAWINGLKIRQEVVPYFGDSEVDVDASYITMDRPFVLPPEQSTFLTLNLVGHDGQPYELKPSDVILWRVGISNQSEWHDHFASSLRHGFSAGAHSSGLAYRVGVAVNGRELPGTIVLPIVSDATDQYSHVEASLQTGTESSALVTVRLFTANGPWQSNAEQVQILTSYGQAVMAAGVPGQAGVYHATLTNVPSGLHRIYAVVNNRVLDSVATVDTSATNGPTAALSYRWVTGEHGPEIEVQGEFSTSAGFLSAELNGVVLVEEEGAGFTWRFIPAPGQSTMELIVRDALGRTATDSFDYHYTPADPQKSVLSRPTLPDDESMTVGLLGEPLVMQLTLHDALGSRLDRGGDLVTVSLQSSNGMLDHEPIEAQVQYDALKDMYLITLSADERAAGQVTIQVNHNSFTTFSVVFSNGPLLFTESLLTLSVDEAREQGTWPAYQIVMYPADEYGSDILYVPIPEGLSLNASDGGVIGSLENHGWYWTATYQPNGDQPAPVTITATLDGVSLHLNTFYGIDEWFLAGKWQATTAPGDAAKLSLRAFGFNGDEVDTSLWEVRVVPADEQVSVTEPMWDPDYERWTFTVTAPEPGQYYLAIRVYDELILYPYVEFSEPSTPEPSLSLQWTWVSGELGPEVEITGSFHTPAGFLRATLDGEELTAADGEGFRRRLTPLPGTQTVQLVVWDLAERSAAESITYIFAPVDLSQSVLDTSAVQGDGEGLLGYLGEPMELLLKLRDSSGQDLERGGDIVTATISPFVLDGPGVLEYSECPDCPDSGEIPLGEIDVQVVYDEANDLYRITLTATEPALGDLNIQVNQEDFTTFFVAFMSGRLSLADSALELEISYEAEGGYWILFHPRDASGWLSFYLEMPHDFSLSVSSGEVAGGMENLLVVWLAEWLPPLDEPAGVVTITAEFGGQQLQRTTLYGVSHWIHDGDMETSVLNPSGARWWLEARSYGDEPVDLSSHGHLEFHAHDDAPVWVENLQYDVENQRWTFDVFASVAGVHGVDIYFLDRQVSTIYVEFTSEEALPTAALQFDWVAGNEGPELKVVGSYTAPAGLQSATLVDSADPTRNLLVNGHARDFTLFVTPTAGTNELTLTVWDQSGRSVAASAEYTFVPVDPTLSYHNGSAFEAMVGETVEVEVQLIGTDGQPLGRGGDRVTVAISETLMDLTPQALSLRSPGGEIEPLQGCQECEFPEIPEQEFRVCDMDGTAGVVTCSVVYDTEADIYRVSLSAAEPVWTDAMILVNGERIGEIFWADFYVPPGEFSLAHSELEFSYMYEPGLYEVTFYPKDEDGNYLEGLAIPDDFTLSVSNSTMVGEIYDSEYFWSAQFQLPTVGAGPATVSAALGDDILEFRTHYGIAWNAWEWDWTWDAPISDGAYFGLSATDFSGNAVDFEGWDIRFEVPEGLAVQKRWDETQQVLFFTVTAERTGRYPIVVYVYDEEYWSRSVTIWGEAVAENTQQNLWPGTHIELVDGHPVGFFVVVELRDQHGNQVPYEGSFDWEIASGVSHTSTSGTGYDATYYFEVSTIGSYTLQLMRDGEPFANPIALTVTVPGPQASAAHTDMPYEVDFHLAAQRPYTFNVSLKSNADTRLERGGDRVELEGISYMVQDLRNGQYRFTIDLSEPGEFELYVKVNGEIANPDNPVMVRLLGEPDAPELPPLADVETFSWPQRGVADGTTATNIEIRLLTGDGKLRPSTDDTLILTYVPNDGEAAQGVWFSEPTPDPDQPGIYWVKAYSNTITAGVVRVQVNGETHEWWYDILEFVHGALDPDISWLEVTLEEVGSDQVRLTARFYPYDRDENPVYSSAFGEGSITWSLGDGDFDFDTVRRDAQSGWTAVKMLSRSELPSPNDPVVVRVVYAGHEFEERGSLLEPEPDPNSPHPQMSYLDWDNEEQIFAGGQFSFRIYPIASNEAPIPVEFVHIELQSSTELETYEIFRKDVYAEVTYSGLPQGTHTIAVRLNGFLMSTAIELEVLPLVDPSQTTADSEGVGEAIADGAYEVVISVIVRDALGLPITSWTPLVTVHVEGVEVGVFESRGNGRYEYTLTSETPGPVTVTANIGPMTIASWSIFFAPHESDGSGESGESDDDPESLGDDPENSGDEPEEPGDEPEEPGDDPENSGENPEEPGNDPES